MTSTYLRISSLSDTFSNLTVTSSPDTTYEWSEKGIAWPGEANKYTASPGYNLDEIVPPPNWALRFPDGYSNSTPPPNLKEDEHFQNWMRTAGLPTFTKLWGRNDAQNLNAGRYQIIINLSASSINMLGQTCPNMSLTASDFPVKPYHGTKSVVISTVSWIGGKNPFLGWAYVATAALFVALAIAGTIRHLIRPRYVLYKPLSSLASSSYLLRKLGDMSLLSWNRS
jgi:hypothetical protein